MTTSHGVKISRAGYGITTNTVEELVFSSGYGTIKIVKEGSGTLVVGAGDTETATVAHSQSFVPMVMVFVELNQGTGRWYHGMSNLPNGATDDGITVSSATYVDDTNLYLTLISSLGSSKTISYKYYMFGDTAEY